jgi:hypothetical protein
MKADIYRTGLPNVFLLLPEGKPLSSAPHSTTKPLQPLSLWKTRELQGAWVSETLEHDLQAHGFSVSQQRADVTFDAR